MLVVAGEAVGKDSTVDTDGTEYLSNILGVTAGGNQTLVITNNYEVYTWGGDEKGQLGVDSKIDRFAPVKGMEGRYIQSRRRSISKERNRCGNGCKPYRNNQR